MAARLTWRASSRLLLGILLLLLLQSLLPPVELALSKAVLDRAALDLRLGGQPGALAARLPLGAWIALTAGVLAIGQLIQPFSRTLQSMAGDRLTGYFTEQIIRTANGWRGLARFEDPSFADDLRRVRSSGSRVGLEMLVYGAGAVLALFTSVSLALVLARLHPLAPLLMLLASLPLMAMHWEYQKSTSSHLYYKTPDARRLEYSRDSLLAVEPAKDVRLYGLGPFFAEQYERMFERTSGDLDSLRRRLAIWVGFASLLASGAAGGVYAYTVWRITRGTLTPGDLVLYGGAATLLRGSLGGIGFNIAYVPFVLGLSLPSLQRVLDAPPDLPLPDQPRPAPRPARQGIAFEDVGFTYPGAREPVLRGVTFTIKPGEGLALVGHNGAGKTTIVKLLLRMYDPTAGRITLDGVDLRDYDLTDLRQEMGVIFQDYVRYEMTARENIGVGQVATLADEGRLREAARKGGALELIESLPDGLDTQLGREFAGRELSGGEWQKLALARAFVRDCQILVLDEPTAALDAQTEYDVYTRFYDLTHGRMTLLISHRFSTVRMADRILYLADGRIREEGSHAELMRANGEYARLYRLQASQYIEDRAEEATP
jgi:ATP-binding cassette subfamily B protein